MSLTNTGAALKRNTAPARAVYRELVTATPQNLAGFGHLVSDYAAAEIEIVTWPALGWRPVDAGTGNEGGTTEGIFEFAWKDDVLHGRNTAVDDSYVLGWAGDPSKPEATPQSTPPSEMYIGHANYHPDGGQLFFPKDRQPFVAPLAPAGDDITLEDFVAFYFDGSHGLYIHPGIWHEAVFPLAERADFLDKQGKVHARISCEFHKEFGAYLHFPLVPPASHQ